MNNKFTKTGDLEDRFKWEKERTAGIKRFLNAYRNGLAKQTTYHSIKHDAKKNSILQSQIYNNLNDIEKKLIQNES